MKSTAFHYFEFYHEAIRYFFKICLEINGKLIIELKQRLAYLFYNQKNFKLIYHSFVETGYVECILAYKLSQDHIETFFSCIQPMGAFNNDPSCTHLRAAYKRLLHHNEVKSSAEANCIPIENILILTVLLGKKDIRFNYEQWPRQ